MGAKCCAESKQSGVPTEVPDVMTDLPAIDLGGIRDVYARFEASLPFNRTLLAVIIACIEEAEKACGETGFVTLATLREQLKTPSWKPLDDPNSALSKTLLSSAFKNSTKNQEADQIDADWLRVFALLHCSGKPIDKTNAFYNILQEGGFEKHAEISAGDKDFAPVFDKICAFSTTDVFELALETGTEDIYNADEKKKIGHKDVFETIREEIWLEDVFGAQSRMGSEAWVAKVKLPAANWIFNSEAIRQKVFAEAKITPRHVN